ncbi:MAG: cytochrome c biogenesis protein DipZ [Candidatus Roizmanbacteria bacterium]|nr:cytochrome c biogenesis protein DipZ [Candidatus Roizmanbacteria bacterium]
MMLLIAFAFMAGVVTILSPCILPILPIILSSSVDTTGKQRPLGVVTGFVLSFTFFTLFLSTLVRLIGIPADSMRLVSIVVLMVFGMTLFIPRMQVMMERLMGFFVRFAPSARTKHGFWGGFVIGLSLGLLWTPCVGPILASVITLAISGTVTGQAIIITLAYSLGTAIPMFLIITSGSTALQKIPWLVSRASAIQKAFGVVMVITAIGILFNVDRQFQTYILQTFPQYGVGLTQFENSPAVKEKLTLPAQTGYPPAPEIIPGGKWFNSKPLTLAQLKGKVVLVDFWTYSCINCIRTLPYLRTWWEKYNDNGLVIIGVHSPEFEFEKDADNVEQAITDFKITYPVVQDNDFATWRAYQNNYWPAKYLIDTEGKIRYTHFGEGEYDETERVIQELLKETGSQKLETTVDNNTYEIQSRTPELYIGYGRSEYFASPEPIAPDTAFNYSSPSDVPYNHFSFEGTWTITKEYAQASKDARLFLHFEAQKVFLVMRSKGEPTQVEVYVDDKKQDSIIVSTDKLYQLISLPTPGTHILRLEFNNANAQLFAFTFG